MLNGNTMSSKLVWDCHQLLVKVDPLFKPLLILKDTRLLLVISGLEGWLSTGWFPRKWYRSWFLTLSQPLLNFPEGCSRKEWRN